MSFFEELQQRGLIKQCTDPVWLKSKLESSEINFYTGFDPTADALHVGHLLPLVFAKRMKDNGHHPMMLIGGATAAIGDPTGKNDMRKMLSSDELKANTLAIDLAIRELLGFDTLIFDNKVWFDKLGFLELIREVGSHFSVNNMLRADCFKTRMESDKGLTFLEFNYMIMQAFDFFKLHKDFSCQLQVGGDDQWSNILAGIDLIHKKNKTESFGLTLPLLVTASGKKMGKTEAGTVWLDKTKTSVFDFFQFWRNVDDADVIGLFKLMTFVSLEEINAMPFSTGDEINSAKKRLAVELTRFVHGEEEANKALQQATDLFEKHSTDSIQSTEVADDEFDLAGLLMLIGLTKSRGESRRLVEGKGISINDQLMSNAGIRINKSTFGSEFVVRKGKKSFFKFSFKQDNLSMTNNDPFVFNPRFITGPLTKKELEFLYEHEKAHAELQAKTNKRAPNFEVFNDFVTNQITIRDCSGSLSAEHIKMLTKKQGNRKKRRSQK